MLGYQIQYGVVSVALVATGAMAADQLPGTLNFANETGARVNQIAGWEDSGNNVKEIEYGDFDQDGDLDVAIAAAGGIFGLRRNKLYRNDAGVFNEISNTSVIPGFATLDLSRHLFFRDYDADGWLDLVVVNDDLAGGGPIKIYMNQHPGGVFSHFTEEGASRGLTHEASCGGVTADVDNDGDFDIYSGNYPGPSQDTLFLNDGTGNFSIVTSTHVPVDSDYTIDIASADMNGDGKLDLLVSNHSTNYAYYNDLQNQADHGVGDYKYGPSGYGGRQNVGAAGNDGAMEPADFNNDGLMDFYWTNRVGSHGDRVMVNIGNSGSGNATFTEVTPPAYTQTVEGNKIAVADLNGDNRTDVLVSSPAGRPAVLRNTSVNGLVSFVEWTPAPAFPSGSTHVGHHGGLFDTTGDGDIDIFFGGNTNDHLFENVASNELDEKSIGVGSGGTLPAFHNLDPVAVSGRVGVGAQDFYILNSMPAGARVSVVLNGTGDYRLELLNFIDFVIETSDRGGLGIEEAFEITIPTTGTYRLRVSGLDCGPVAADVDGDCSVGFSDVLDVIADWGPNPGSPADVNGDGDVGFADILQLIGQWGDVQDEYVLEVLSRTN